MTVGEVTPPCKDATGFDPLATRLNRNPEHSSPESLSDQVRILEEYPLTVKPVAEILGLSVPHVYALAHEGRLAHIRIGSGPRPRLRFRRADVLALVEVREARR